MFEPTLHTEAYNRDTRQSAQRCLDAVTRYCNSRGYQLCNYQGAARVNSGNPWMNFALAATDEPTYMFKVTAGADNLRYFSSHTSSYRGNIKVHKSTLDDFLDEMDKRKAEWLRKGRPMGRL